MERILKILSKYRKQQLENKYIKKEKGGYKEANRKKKMKKQEKLNIESTRKIIRK